MPAELLRVGDELHVDLARCRGAEFSDSLLKIKSIPGRRYDPDNKLWALPAEPELAERALQMLNPIVSTELVQWVREERLKAAEELTTPLPEDGDLLIPWARERAPWQPETIKIVDEEVAFHGLMRHQRPVVDLAAEKARLLICDDMGLGKTGTAISAVEEWRLRNKLDDGFTLPEGPRLVVCPNSVKGSWVRELKLWLGPDVPHQVIDGTTAQSRHNQLQRSIDEGNQWAIVNWEQLRIKREKVKTKNGGHRTIVRMKEPLFEETDWLAEVADEIHRIKNRKSQATQGFWRVQAPNGIMLGLSGTPLMNQPDELWSPLRWLWPDDYHQSGMRHRPGARPFMIFHDQYTEEYEGFFGKIVIGVKNPDALRFELKGRLVRRTKGQVLDLPDKVRVPVPLELNKGQRKLYDEAEKAMWLEVEQAVEAGDKSAIGFAEAARRGAPASALYRLPNGAARTVRLRQIIETPANLGGEDDSAVLDAFVERVVDSQPKQWIGFCEFKPTVDRLLERFEKKGLVAKAYTGDVDPKVRTVLEDQFQRGEIDVLVGTIKAMYQGITLTAGNAQFWCSRSWVPAENEQGEDRQHRIGQENKVTVLIAQAQDTVATDKVEPTNRVKEGIVKTVIPKDEIEEEAE